jgi:hypothetical protein
VIVVVDNNSKILRTSLSHGLTGLDERANQVARLEVDYKDPKKVLAYINLIIATVNEKY